jgi:hypothetical protein
MEIEKYNLLIIDKNDSTCSVKLVPKVGNALIKERRKLYIISNKTEVLYVGEANTSILKRFQRGCSSFNHYIKNGKARGGYKGYKWLNKVNNYERSLKVTVATFREDYDDRRDFIEAIEGELVYLIRNRFGYWPRFQNEIHFSNCEESKEIALNLLEKLFLD